MPLLRKTRLRGGGGEKHGNTGSRRSAKTLGEEAFPVHPLSTFKIIDDGLKNQKENEEQVRMRRPKAARMEELFAGELLSLRAWRALGRWLDLGGGGCG